MTGPSREVARRRQLALALVAVGVVLLLSSVTWFGASQPGVGAAQIVVGLVVAAAGAVLLQRVRRP